MTFDPFALSPQACARALPPAYTSQPASTHSISPLPSCILNSSSRPDPHRPKNARTAYSCR
eukprot:1331979-Pleurochrysis_carterae.AAC.1